jgi:hypothetical protein
MGLTLNAQTYGGGADVSVPANDTLLDHDTIIGANKTGAVGSGSNAPLALIYPGPEGASPSDPLYSTGNVAENLNITDGVNNDGFSFAYQEDGRIFNITHYGSRLGLYVDSDVTVDNYHYTPNPACLGAAQGFWITAPSNHITIKNFSSAGPGGVIGGAGEPHASSDITIENETFGGASGGYHLAISNVTGLTISKSSFGSDNSLVVNSLEPISLDVSDTTIPSVVLAPYEGKSYSSLSATFTDDTFPAYAPGGTPAPTFDQTHTVGPGTVSVTGGTWSNEQGGFYSGTNTSFAVDDLAPVDAQPPTITGTATVGSTLTAYNPTWYGGTPTYAFQWTRNGNPITGATSDTYVPTTNDVGKKVAVTVTATNSVGSTSATSPAVTVKNS